jgi:MerR family transcriptional regulator, light-induced transcriptional regulator
VAQYSIRELEHLSGIKAHTIRIWEQRYGVLHPQRTETNIRYYDDADLKAILNISLLNEHGYKISRIAGMSALQITEEVMKVAATTASDPQQMNALLIAMIEMDEERFDKVLTTVILQKGLERTMLEILCPFLVKTGLLWQVGSITPAQEHLVSNIIRQKLYVAIDGQLPVNKNAADRFLLYLPEGELHEIGLLFSNYLLRTRGYHVMYLGQNMPFGDLQTCVGYYRPHYVCTAFTYMPERDQVQSYVQRLSELAPQVLVYVGGHLVQLQDIAFPTNIIPIASLPDFIQHIDQLKKNK